MDQSPESSGQAPQPAYQPRPKHPQTNVVMVLGILSLVTCQLAGPFAWVMGNRALSEIDAEPGRWDGRSEINLGRILGIVSTVLLLVVVGGSILALSLVFLGIGVIGFSNGTY